MSLFNIELESTDLLDRLEKKLSDGAGGSRDFARSAVLRQHMSAQSKHLERAIRMKAPKKGGHYLSKNVKVKPGYSNSAPYASFVIHAKGSAARYWIQREAVPAETTGSRKYHPWISARPLKWLYVPPRRSPVFRLVQGYDKRGPNSNSQSLARKAGYPFTTFVHNKSMPDKGTVWGYRGKRDYKKKRDGKVLFFAERRVKGGQAHPEGRYIRPSIMSRDEAMLRSITNAWVKYWNERTGSRKAK